MSSAVFSFDENMDFNHNDTVDVFPVSFVVRWFSVLSMTESFSVDIQESLFFSGVVRVFLLLNKTLSYGDDDTMASNT